MDEHDAQKPETALESWKEIAAHLNRDARTVRRWEKSEGLPVHRHRHLARSSVYAFPSELDAWRVGRRPAAPEPPAPGWSILRLGPAVGLAAVTLLALGGGRFAGGRLEAHDGQPTVRRVWMAPQFSSSARTISSDGRYIGFITPDRSLAVHDIQNDVTTVLVPRVRQQGASGSPESPALSRDGRRIAYTWFETGRRRQMPSGKAFLGVSADVSCGASLASLPWRYRTPLRCRLEAPRRGWRWERP